MSENFFFYLRFVYSEKDTKFCEISTLLLSTVHTDKSKVEILQNFVAFSEYMNFTSISSFKILKEIKVTPFHPPPRALTLLLRSCQIGLKLRSCFLKMAKEWVFFLPDKNSGSQGWWITYLLVLNRIKLRCLVIIMVSWMATGNTRWRQLEPIPYPTYCETSKLHWFGCRILNSNPTEYRMNSHQRMKICNALYARHKWKCIHTFIMFWFMAYKKFTNSGSLHTVV